MADEKTIRCLGCGRMLGDDEDCSRCDPGESWAERIERAVMRACARCEGLLKEWFPYSIPVVVLYALALSPFLAITAGVMWWRELRAALRGE